MTIYSYLLVFGAEKIAARNLNLNWFSWLNCIVYVLVNCSSTIPIMPRTGSSVGRASASFESSLIKRWNSLKWCEYQPRHKVVVVANKVSLFKTIAPSSSIKTAQAEISSCKNISAWPVSLRRWEMSWVRLPETRPLDRLHLRRLGRDWNADTALEY